MNGSSSLLLLLVTVPATPGSAQQEPPATLYEVHIPGEEPSSIEYSVELSGVGRRESGTEHNWWSADAATHLRLTDTRGGGRRTRSAWMKRGDQCFFLWQSYRVDDDESWEARRNERTSVGTCGPEDFPVPIGAARRDCTYSGVGVGRGQRFLVYSCPTIDEVKYYLDPESMQLKLRTYELGDGSGLAYRTYSGWLDLGGLRTAESTVESDRSGRIGTVLLDGPIPASRFDWDEVVRWVEELDGRFVNDR